MQNQTLSAITSLDPELPANAATQPAWWTIKPGEPVCGRKLADSFEAFAENIGSLGKLLCDSRTIATEDSAHVGRILSDYAAEARGLVALWHRTHRGQ